MHLNVRRTSTIVETRSWDEGRSFDQSLRRVAVVWVVENPFAGQYVEDLSPLIDASVDLGRAMAAEAVAHIRPEDIQAYGKGGIVGLAGQQEHANALLTTVFADPIREAIGGAEAWISSVTKRGAPGTPIDVPINHKDDVYVRSHYDAMSLTLADAPQSDEVAVIFCLANRGRLNARVGGLTHAEVVRRRA